MITSAAAAFARSISPGELSTNRITTALSWLITANQKLEELQTTNAEWAALDLAYGSVTTVAELV
jgi:hypothetical protein